MLGYKYDNNNINSPLCGVRSSFSVFTSYRYNAASYSYSSSFKLGFRKLCKGWKPDKWKMKFKIGDRILLTTKYGPLPKNSLGTIVVHKYPYYDSKNDFCVRFDNYLDYLSDTDHHSISKKSLKLANSSIIKERLKIK